MSLGPSRRVISGTSYWEGEIKRKALKHALRESFFPLRGQNKKPKNLLRELFWKIKQSQVI